MNDRRNHSDAIDAIEAQLREGKLRMDAIEKQLQQNTQMTVEIHGWISKGRGFFAVCGWLASGVKWILGLAVSAVALWVAIFGTKPPPGSSE